MSSLPPSTPVLVYHVDLASADIRIYVAVLVLPVFPPRRPRRN
jgi:hypothetical protein